MPTRKWATEFVVNTTTAGNQTESSVTALADGGFVITWRDEGPVDDLVRWQRFDALGNKVGAEVVTASFGGGNQSQPAITTLNDGNIWIVQTDYDIPTRNNVIGEIFTPLGTSVTIQDGSIGVIDGLSYAAADNASLGTHGSVVAYVVTEHNAGGTAIDRDVVIRGYDAAGGTLFSTVLVNFDGNLSGADNPYPKIAASLDGSSFVVTWSDGDVAKFRVYAFNGNAITSEFEVITGTGDEYQPDVAWLDNDRFVTVWANTQVSPLAGGDGNADSVNFIITHRTGSAVSERGVVNTSIRGSQSSPVVTALPDGGFAVAWVDDSWTFGEISGTAIRLQVFNTLGEKVGGEVLVNSSTIGNQNDVAIATLADGRVIVTWTDASATEGDTAGTAVRAQIIDPRDGIISGTDNATIGDTLYGNDAANDEINGYAGDDTLYGLAGADVLYGGDGNDVLQGGRGDDTLYGGNGNDNMIGGVGADEFHGGTGFDIANYANAKFAVSVALDGSIASLGDAADDVFFNVENVNGSRYNDVLIGDAGTNSLFGADGADELNGKNGTDKLRGGLGADTLTGGAGNDTFTYTSQTEGGDIITDFSSTGAGNNDRFLFTGSAFGLGIINFFTAANFQSDVSHTANTTDIRFFFETDTGILRFDADGSTGTIDPIIIATLQPGATVSFSDIVLV